MSDPTPAYLLFHTSNHAFRAEKLLGARQLAVKLVPVPRHLSSDCGVCLRLAPDARHAAAEALAGTGVELAGVHPPL
ncbi:DUF3343 domain-containing protein [Propionivibrio dicarboxylicus]|uniref:Putative Se/S carrier protein-like domain-containing protein n=1 Tax=Propionivibrio dicarboxylicus TaxID=83767 RepID=A0A1G8IVM6_9RHOO|nr:DUF3343 domain-containing protein [Propionivibrio dicarboxylicus]SDI22916.1 Protein of unknown function [Propionivibrio dicarboxylicus]